MIDLESIKNDTEAVIIVHADEKGKVLNSIDSEYDTNIALMMETAFTMCNGMSADLENGSLNLLLSKSDNGFTIIRKLADDSLILILSRDVSKLGLLMKYMETEKNFKAK